MAFAERITEKKVFLHYRKNLLAEKIENKICIVKITFAQRAVWRNGGSNPQTILCEIERYYPVRSSVEAATAPSRWDVVCNPRGQQPEKEKKLGNNVIN
ncbi:MAG: hypothetical protein FWF70_00100 [Bacteroidetes bacterium]|nr:hypothetical protein [Bacteroidota bacterium]